MRTPINTLPFPMAITAPRAKKNANTSRPMPLKRTAVFTLARLVRQGRQVNHGGSRGCVIAHITGLIGGGSKSSELSNSQDGSLAQSWPRAESQRRPLRFRAGVTWSYSGVFALMRSGMGRCHTNGGGP